mmetsp:Transcript_128449/g.357571  ORF Transcript_128449/g.357571 Transcript_128449/m.357571 type:complete len:201 (+) Transcript_128449:250-852(+)
MPASVELGIVPARPHRLPASAQSPRHLTYEFSFWRHLSMHCAAQYGQSPPRERWPSARSTRKLLFCDFRACREANRAALARCKALTSPRRTASTADFMLAMSRDLVTANFLNARASRLRSTSARCRSDFEVAFLARTSRVHSRFSWETCFPRYSRSMVSTRCCRADANLSAVAARPAASPSSAVVTFLPRRPSRKAAACT